jgi:DNA-directed RNA polymerase sigma subunit (sigma70/sigma32)
MLLQTIAAGNAAAAKLATGWDGPRRADLKRRVERGSRAKDTLASAFLWDAEWHARHCAAHCGGSVDDLRQEVLLGVLWAIETFDPDAGYRFDRHARIGMLRAVRRCLDGHARHA